MDAFMMMASTFARTSEAKRLQVGCLIVKDGGIISCGVNGSPSGWPTNVCESVDNVTEWYVRHAEINALNKLRRSHSVSTGATMFCTHACCLPCAIDLVDAGISQFFYRETYRDDSGLEYLRTKGLTVVKM